MAYINGIGKTKFGILNKSLAQIMYEAMMKAFDDSGLGISDIGAIFISNFLGGPCENQLHLNAVLASLMPGAFKPIVRIETACASGGSAIWQALLATNKFDNVMVIGAEKLSSLSTEGTTTAIAMAGDRQVDQSAGLIFPANYALMAQQHMRKYKTTHYDLELVALKAHENAKLNPLAHFFEKEITIDEIRRSPVVASPLTVYDCSPLTDGASAVIISKNRYEHSVEVIASALVTDTISLTQRDSLTSFPAAKIAARKAFDEANIAPEVVDVIELHDCFTIAELIGMEDIGICKPGESKEWIQEGKTTRYGDLPINPSGGLKGCGHPIGATGVSQVYEITAQLRGEAGKNQVVPSPEIGLTHNIGGVGGTAVITILRK